MGQQLANELLLEATARLAQAKAQGIPPEQWPQFATLLERALAAAAAVVERQTQNAKAAYRLRMIPDDIKREETGHVEARLAEVRKINPRISKGCAMDKIAIDLAMPRSRVRQYLRGKK